MRIIIGLGNPGKKYASTRHNIGFYILEYLLASTRVSFQVGKGDYYYARFSSKGVKTLLIKPTTFMNESGRAVKQVLRHFSLHEEEILIVYDDFNLPLGTLRLRPSGSDGGHNGIASIIYHLGSDRFDRMRVGIGADFEDAVDHVLSVFDEEENKIIEQLLPVTKNAINCWLRFGIENTMNTYNGTHINTNTN